MDALRALQRARRDEMLSLIAKGWTLQMVADKFELTRQRVSQIVGRVKRAA
jgi:transcriptional regulator